MQVSRESEYCPFICNQKLTGNRYILACVQFSIASSVIIESLRLEKFLRLISDHVSLGDDLASYDKEKKAYDRGRTYHLINAAVVVQRLFSLSTTHSAKALAYAMQLEFEVEIDQELSRMRAATSLTAEEWKFVGSVLTMTAGNVFTPLSRLGTVGSVHELWIDCEMFLFGYVFRRS